MIKPQARRILWWIVFLPSCLFNLITIAFVGGMMFRNYPFSDSGECPEAGMDFWEKSIQQRMESTQGQRRTLTIHEGSRYDTGTQSWVVPFSWGEERLTALLDCRGAIELSVPPQ